MRARRGERRRSRWRLAALAAAGVTASFLACTVERPLQGEAYDPDNTLPIAPPTDRTRDGGAECDECDAAADVIAIPTTDASNAPSNTCETARAIGTLSGDTAGPSISAEGTCSEWLELRATENDDGVFGVPMTLAVTLRPPPDDDLDLYAFLNPTKDLVSCATPFAAAETPSAGSVETLSLSWGEGSIANGADDGRTVGLLVFHRGPSCAGTQQWNLVIDGNP